MPELRFYTIDQLADLEDEHRDWGPWRLCPEHQSLTHYTYGYEIDLRECLNSAEVLDWIAQIAGKEWPDATEAIAGLVCAMDDVLGFQQNLCGSGVPHSITADTICARVRQVAEWAPLLVRGPDRVPTDRLLLHV